MRGLSHTLGQRLGLRRRGHLPGGISLGSISTGANGGWLCVLRGTRAGSRSLVGRSLSRRIRTGTAWAARAWRKRVVAPRSRTARRVGATGTARTAWKALARGKPARGRRVRHVSKVGAWSRARARRSTTSTPVTWGWASVEVVGWVGTLAECTRSWWSIGVRSLSARTSSGSLANLVSLGVFYHESNKTRVWFLDQKEGNGNLDIIFCAFRE